MNKKEYDKVYYQKNKEKIGKRNKDYNKTHFVSVETKKRNREWHKEYIQRPSIKEKKRNRFREYYKNPEFKMKSRERNGRYYQENKEEICKRNKENRYKRIKDDPIFRLRCLLSMRLRDAFRKYSKKRKIKQSYEYNIDYNAIIEYLKPFPKNIGNYHIDHIIPLSWFNFNSYKEIEWAFAPENHQWLSKRDNLSKGNRFISIKQIEGGN